MESIYCWNKLIGETSAECLTRFKNKYPELTKEKIGHLGTLDPMASGLIIYLVGNKTKEFKELQNLPKEYNSIFLLGIETDSYDILGIPKLGNIKKSYEIAQKEIEKEIQEFCGKIKQTPPLYSSIRIGGKSLYYWARTDKKIDIKPREREIYNLKINKIYTLSIRKIETTIEIIRKVKGDFRQKEILEQWYILIKFLKTQHIKELKAIDLTITCSSGTYIRSIANDFGKRIGIGAITYNICRTRIGPYILEGL